MHRPEERLLYWRLQLAGWALFGVANAAGALWGAGLPPVQALAQGTAIGAMGLGLSHLLDHWIRQRALSSKPLWQRALRMIIYSTLIGIPAGIITHLTHMAPWQAEDLQVAEELRPLAAPLVQAANWSAVLISWSLVYLILQSFRERTLARLRESEMARALQFAELRLLKNQLNPHFLFNALNTVRALIAEDPGRAQEAVTHLARTLRYTLGSGQEELVTLERELAIVDDYLAIEALRLGERLKLSLEVSPQARSQMIPVMLLQMLVENAIKHGIAELPQGGLLKIGAQIEAGSLLLSVQNARPASPAADPSAASIGLRNSAERLRLLFGAGARLDLEFTQPDLAVARVKIPCVS